MMHGSSVRPRRLTSRHMHFTFSDPPSVKRRRRQLFISRYYTYILTLVATDYCTRGVCVFFETNSAARGAR